MLIAVFVTACSSFAGSETPTDSLAPTTATQDDTTTSSTGRDCVEVTAGAGPVDTGEPGTDAQHISGELFVCSDDVVVVDTVDLNEVAAGAQLAAAVGGPLLLQHPWVASEVGRLKPYRVHLIGSVDVLTPADAEVLRHTTTDAVDLAKEALGTESEIRLPIIPDARTIVETVLAIRDGDRVVLPQTSPSTSTTTSSPDIDESEVVSGLAVASDASAVWMADAADPLTILMAAASGHVADATVVAIDADDVLAHPEVSEAIAGRGADSIRYIGHAPDASEWELAVLANGQQVPGGGFWVLPKEGKRRYVAFYGHPETTALGALGEQGPKETLQRMQPFLDAYEGDGSQAIATFEMIASVAAANLTEDEDYSYEWPISTFDAWVETARENDAYIILDLQPGYDDFLTQAKQYEELLKEPFVGLALDPEWRLAPGQKHLVQVGRVEASEVNQVIQWLADLVRDNGLPQKMLMVHQFRTFMIQNREILEERPEIQLIIQMDGDGTEAQKDNTYAALNQGAEDAFWAWGWKNFFDEDEPGPPTPESTMAKDPSPVYVSYQ